MKKTKIPEEIRWIVPVIHELRDIAEIDELSSNSRTLVKRNMTAEMFELVRDWADSEDSKESNEMMMALIALNSIDLFDLPRPDTNFERLLKELEIFSPGRKSAALENIFDSFVGAISSKETRTLVEKIRNILNHEVNRLVLVHCLAIMIRIFPEEIKYREQLQKIVQDEVSGEADSFVIGQGVGYLLSTKNVRPEDVNYAASLLFDQELEECSGILLEAILSCPSIGREQKENMIKSMQSVDSSELQFVIDEYRDIERQEE